MTLIISPMMQSAAQAPFADLTAIVGTGGLVVLAPHPDDESLGCGALLRAAALSSRRVAVIIVTDGRMSHPTSPSMPGDALVRLRSREVRAAVAALHPNIALVELGYRDCEAPKELAASQSAAAAIADTVDAVDATALVTTWQSDPHQDHAATAALARCVLGLRPALTLWSYPIWGRFAPTKAMPKGRILQFDAAPHRAMKAAAIACHRSQMTKLIDDDPKGFMMTAEMQAHFLDHPEVFLADAQHA